VDINVVHFYGTKYTREKFVNFSKLGPIKVFSPQFPANSDSSNRPQFFLQKKYQMLPPLRELQRLARK
jgi:hypothetical protein